MTGIGGHGPLEEIAEHLRGLFYGRERSTFFGHQLVRQRRRGEEHQRDKVGIERCGYVGRECGFPNAPEPNVPLLEAPAPLTDGRVRRQIGHAVCPQRALRRQRHITLEHAGIHLVVEPHERGHDLLRLRLVVERGSVVVAEYERDPLRWRNHFWGTGQRKEEPQEFP